jgi:acetylornithine deacetylase/succinyl-diaminopimelate desuccinylase-like protein
MLAEDHTAQSHPDFAEERSTLRAAIAESMRGSVSDLKQLVRIPSVSGASGDPEALRASALATAQLLSDTDMASARLLELDGAAPYVFVEVPASEGAPTVLLYAHHDVKPAGDEALWQTPPFHPTVSGSLLRGRGAADDKAAIVVHASAMRALGAVCEDTPIGIKVLVEGEEEIGSPHLAGFLERYGELLHADAIVLADNENWAAGVPALTTSLRGIVECTIEVRVLDGPVHSGSFGGPLTDAMSVLAVTIASLYDDEGNVAIPGLAAGPPPSVDVDEDEFRARAGARPGLRLVGTGSITERLWTRPAVAVLGLDAPSVEGSYTKLEPVARAKVSLRIPGGQDPSEALEALGAHLESHAPWGVDVHIEPETSVGPVQVDTDRPIFGVAARSLADGFGHPPVLIGGGGSIPTASAIAETFPEAALLLTGVAGPRSNAHAENEVVDLSDLERSCLAEALFLHELARPGGDTDGASR